MSLYMIMALLDAYVVFLCRWLSHLKKNAECDSTYHINYEKWI